MRRSKQRQLCGSPSWSDDQILGGTLGGFATGVGFDSGAPPSGHHPKGINPRRATIGVSSKMLAEMREHPGGSGANMETFASVQPDSSRCSASISLAAPVRERHARTLCEANECENGT